jgi:hypothetical protein
MDRQTLAQAVAMLVVLAALLRWLPPGETRDRLGRGDPWLSVELDRSLLWPEGDPDEVRLRRAAQLRAMYRSKEQTARWRRLLEHVATLQGQAGRGDVVQVRGLSRNEIWPLAYDLYPARVEGRPLEEGGSAAAPVLPGARWVLTAGPPGVPGEALTLEPGPAR